MQLNAITSFASKALNYCKSTYQKISSRVVSFLNPVRKANQVALHQAQKDIGEKCGVYGIYNKHRQNVAKKFIDPMNRLQHRGQQACGVVMSDGFTTKNKVGPGMVTEVLGDRISDDFYQHKPYLGIGHTLYGTSRSKKGEDKVHAQPLIIERDGKSFSLVHNGNIPDLNELKNFLFKECKFDEETIDEMNDTEMIAQAIFYNYSEKSMKLEDAIAKTTELFKGGYSLLAMSKDKLIAVRDPAGFRPLSMAETKDGDIVFSSETTSFKALGAKFIKEVEPGTMEIVAGPDRIFTKPYTDETQKKIDAFELVYFSRPDSVIGGASVDAIRRRSGKSLGRRLKDKLKVDFVVPVPDSGTAAALGFAETMRSKSAKPDDDAGIPARMALIKNRHRRTFTEKGDGLDRKFSLVDEAIKGKNLALVDDSIVRGKTSKKLIDFVKAAGPKKVHMIVASPPVFYPDYYGIDTKDQNELIAFRNRVFKEGKEERIVDLDATIENIRKELGVDSLHFLNLDELRGAIEKSKLNPDHVNYSCFDGTYPVEIGQENRDKTKIYELSSAA